MFLTIFADGTLRRADLGLPAKWETIEEWVDSSRDVAKSVQISPPVAILKNPEVPGLTDYGVQPSDEFWKIFPSNYPEGPRKNGVNVKALEELIKLCEPFWILPEKYAPERQ